MSKPPLSENLELEGPAGRLEALIQTPQGVDAVGAAVICHPHPLHGGTMQNKVAHTLARAFVSRGFLALRFNFRGVGQSAGEFDEGDGELADALAAARAAEQRVPEAPLWFAGFSFGAAIAMHAAAESKAAGLITVAPATARVRSLAGTTPDCPWLVIQGDQDELVAIDDTIEWVNGLDPGPELEVFEGTEHFFHGKLVELRKSVERFVEAHAPRAP